jgi:hypothetical protein
MSVIPMVAPKEGGVLKAHALDGVQHLDSHKGTKIGVDPRDKVFKLRVAQAVIHIFDFRWELIVEDHSSRGSPDFSRFCGHIPAPGPGNPRSRIPRPSGLLLWS